MDDAATESFWDLLKLRDNPNPAATGALAVVELALDLVELLLGLLRQRLGALLERAVLRLLLRLLGELPRLVHEAHPRRLPVPFGRT